MRDFHIIAPATAGHFSAVYQNIGAPSLDNYFLKPRADLLTLFNAACSNVLDLLLLLKKLSVLDLKLIPG